MLKLKEKLMQTYPFRIELHAHTNPVSGCSQLTPAEVVQLCQQAGANGVAITNHALPWNHDIPCNEWAERYLTDYRLACEEGARLGIAVYLGMEMRFPDSNNDYLIYGISEEFVKTAWKYLDKDLESFYKACKTDNCLIIQAHPFRDGLTRANTACLDGVEVFNLHPNHNSRVGLAAKWQLSVGGVILGGTDLHNRGHEGQIFTCFRRLPTDSYELAKEIKKGDYLFKIGDSVILP